MVSLGNARFPGIVPWLRHVSRYACVTSHGLKFKLKNKQTLKEVAV